MRSSRCSWARRSARARTSSRPRPARSRILTSDLREPADLRDIRVSPTAAFEFAPHNCFACGTLNTNGLQMALHLETERSWAELRLDSRFEGWQGITHGGIVATILDEVMAWALVAEDHWGVTARMQV